MMVMKGIGLGLTYICQGMYDGNERHRVRVNVHMSGNA